MNDPVEVKPKRGGWRAGSGRKFGVPNRPPKTLAEQAREHCPLVIAMLAEMTRDETAPHEARIGAATTLLRISAGQPSTDGQLDVIIGAIQDEIVATYPTRVNRAASGLLSDAGNLSGDFAFCAIKRYSHF